MFELIVGVIVVLVATFFAKGMGRMYKEDRNIWFSLWGLMAIGLGGLQACFWYVLFLGLLHVCGVFDGLTASDPE